MTESQVTENSAAAVRSIKKPRKGAKPHEVGQRPWSEDPDIMNRVLVVGQLTWPAQDIPGLPIQKIARMLKIGVATVHEDRQRFLTLERKAVAQGREAAIDRLQLVIAEAFRGLQALPASSTFATHRPKYLDVIEKAAMSIAKLDGSLDLKPQINIGIGIQTGPSLRELYEKGLIVDADYEAGLRLAALQEHPLEAEYRALPSPSPLPQSEVVVPPATSTPANQVARRATVSDLSTSAAAERPLKGSPEIDVSAHGLASFEEEPSDYDEDDDE